MPEEAAVSTETGGTQQPSTQVIGESQSDVSERTEASAGNDQKPAGSNGQKPKELSRYERTKRERAAFKAQQAEFGRQREAFARERAEFEAKQKPQRDYTLDDLKKYRRQWAKDAANSVWRDDYDPADLVEKADKEIAAMEAEVQAERQSRTVELPPMGSPEHQAQWETAERELAQVDPEFMRAGTRLDQKLRQIMGSEDGNIYRQHPRGIVAAYHRARMELMEGDFDVLRTENSKLKNELQRYTGLTSIGGGAPARIGSGNRVESVDDFAKLSLADMRKHLKRGAKHDGVPWF